MPFTGKIEKNYNVHKEAINHDHNGQSLLPNYILFRPIKAIIGHSFIEVFQRKKCLQYQVGHKQMRLLLYRVATDVLLPPARTVDIHYSLAC